MVRLWLHCLTANSQSKLNDERPTYVNPRTCAAQALAEDVPIWLPCGCLQLRVRFERSRGLRQLGKDLPMPRMRAASGRSGGTWRGDKGNRDFLPTASQPSNKRFLPFSFPIAARRLYWSEGLLPLLRRLVVSQNTGFPVIRRTSFLAILRRFHSGMPAPRTGPRFLTHYAANLRVWLCCSKTTSPQASLA